MSKTKRQETQEKADMPVFVEKKLFICALHMIFRFSHNMGLNFVYEIFTEDQGEDAIISNELIVFFDQFRLHGSFVCLTACLSA